MSNTQEITTSDTLDTAETFEETILKMYALTELVPMVLSEDYGGPQNNKLRDGVTYLLADIHRDMEQMSIAYWKLSQTKPRRNDSADLRLQTAQAPRPCEAQMTTGAHG